MRIRSLSFVGFAVSAFGAFAKDVPDSLRPFFTPPPEYVGKLGSYASPLKFSDGRPIKSPAEWPARRAEILSYWHGQMGAWPALVARPKFELSEKQDRGEGVTQHRVEIEVAPGTTQHGYLLVPAGSETTRRPAVLVVFYAPEVSVAYQGPRPLEGQAKKMLTTGERGAGRDFALQLARRGFVTLSIGTPGDDAYQPAQHGATCQPLSLLAYIAANCHTALAQRPEVDPGRIGVMGHSYGGKWAMFASCLYEKFACAVWSDGGVVFDETRQAVNYWEPWYLGFDPAVTRKRGLVTAESPRTGPYKKIFEGGHDLHELHALMAPRPFLVSGGSEDGPARWVSLNHAVAVNRFLGAENRVAMTNREKHSPNAESNEQAFRFLEHFLKR
jgi:dienelactone hydrolase